MEELRNSYDAVVIGGGHNGLIAASYLAKAGLTALVIERTSALGGFARADYVIPEAPAHLVNTGTAHLLSIRHSKVMGELELKKFGWQEIECDPIYAYLAPNGDSIAIFRDVQRTAQDIGRFSKNDAAAYLEFIELINALLEFNAVLGGGDPGIRTPKFYFHLARTAVRNRRLRDKLQLLTSAPPDQLAAEWFEHPYTQALLLRIAAGAGPFDTDGNGLAYAAFGLYHKIGASNPVGGMRMVADVLTRVLDAAGGHVITNAEVTEVLFESGRSSGVRLADGRTIGARCVIATCGPGPIAAMAAAGLDRTTKIRLEFAPTHRVNVGPSLLNVATSKPVVLRRHQDRRTDGADLNQAVGLIGTVEEMKDGLDQARRGMLPSAPAFSVIPNSYADPTMIPAGQGLAYMYLPIYPVNLNGGWGNRKAEAADAIIARAAEYYTGLDAELGRWFETCPDREERMKVPRGITSQVDFSSFRIGVKRPAYGLGGPSGLAPGLFMGGAASHPGAGVSGMAGRLAARRAREFLS